MTDTHRNRELALTDLIRFFTDTLNGINHAIKSQTPGAVIIAHFLGRTGIPIFVRGQLVQPRQLVDGIQAEIRLRGDTPGKYYDAWITTLDSELLRDRFPEPTPLVPFGSGTTTDSTASWKSLPTGPVLPFVETPGWNIKYLEEFTVITSDLVADYADWENWRTPAVRTTATVPTVGAPPNYGRAQVRLTGPPDSIGGAVTAPVTPDVVPDAEFKELYPERNKWTAVHDFVPVIPTNPPTVHAAAFLRVLDRTWQGDLGPYDDQTRFGGFAYGGNAITADACQNQPCGALQLTGDDTTAIPPQSKGKTKLLHFPLMEHPWSFFNHTYRVQIIEREYWHSLDLRYELQWRAEVYDLTDSGQWLGNSDWIWEWSVPNVFGVEIPTPLGSSKLIFGLGPGTAGGIDSERTGTSYWVY
jgi:hypothetical protein